MSDLFSALSRTALSLEAHRLGLDAVGQNLANVNTPGYTRRTVNLAERPPLDGRDAGGGVDVLSVSAARTPLLDARVYREMPAAAREAAVADQLAVVESGFGAPGSSLDVRINEFFDAFSTLAGDPGSTTARQLVVIQGQSLTQSFHDVAWRLEQSQRDSDLDVRSAVDQINGLANTIADLNVAIANAPGSKDALKDQQTNALRELAELIDVEVIRNGDGVNVSVGNGHALVASENVYPVSAVSAASDGFAHIYSGSSDVTSAVTGGKLGGLLYVRDTLIPGYLDRLDAVAVQVVNEVNALHTAGYDLDGTTGNLFFAALSGTAGAAEAISLDAGILADPANISAAGIAASGDNQTARAIAALRNGSPSAMDGWGALVNRVGTDRSAALSEQSTREDVLHQIDSLRAQVSGVSVDEEAATMLRFQRAYEANARFFRVVDGLLDQLIQSVG
ncbi:MAG: flagellar hook-associated protein FlgK [Acidobacteria bacterium]|nr:flagellar hook-associated protein FlgK [Acidobacteriota bacterium]